MTSFFSNLFKSSGGSFLGVDIGSSSIKIVQLRKKGGKAVLETYGELALGPYAGFEIGQATALSPEKTVEALSDLMKEKEVNVTTNVCGVAIPFSSSLMSVIEMPLVSQKQLSAMVPLEARKYIPVPISEVTLDWSVIPKDDSSPEVPEEDSSHTHIEKTDVLLVAIHNDTIARYQEIVRKTGLQSKFFEIEIFSCMRSVLESTHDPVMLLDMGAATTKLYVIEHSVIRSSHTINRGSQEITNIISKSLGISVKEAEVLKRGVGAVSSEGTDIKEIVNLALSGIFDEANRVILNYQNKYNKAIKKVVLVGGGSSLKGLQPLAQEKFQIQVEAGNPFTKTEAPAFIEEILRNTGPEFAVSVGLALRGLQEN